MARDLGDRDMEAYALGTIGAIRVSLGDAGGLADLERCIAMGEAAGSSTVISWRTNLAFSFALLGDLRRCYVAREAAWEAAERFGSVRTLRWLEIEHAAVCYWSGRWDAATQIADALAPDGDDGARHYMKAMCHLWRGRIRLAGGRLEAALEDARAASDLAREAGDPQDLHPTRAFLARSLLAAGRRDEAAALAEHLLAGLGGGVLGPDLGADLGLVLADLGIPVDALDRRGVAPSPWLEAARALAAGDPLAAADRYAAIGSRPDEADARRAAARRLAGQGRQAEADAQEAAARAFLASTGLPGLA